jgi:hypothetical protein
VVRKKPEEPVRITTATRPRSQDIAARQRRYIFSMSIRTVCFILAIVFRSSPAAWFFIAGAIVLPYVAVVIANAGSSPDPGGMDAYVPDRAELEGTPRRTLDG